MNEQDRTERTRQSHQPRKRFKGVMGVIVGHGKSRRAVPRSVTHGGRSPAKGGWTCGDSVLAPREQSTRSVPGRYRVSMPRGRFRYIDPVLQAKGER